MGDIEWVKASRLPFPDKLFGNPKGNFLKCGFFIFDPPSNILDSNRSCRAMESRKILSLPPVNTVFTLFSSATSQMKIM